MKLQRCENGHFYDRDKYSYCPHCKNSAPNVSFGVTVPVGMDNDVTVPVSSMGAYTDENATVPITTPAEQGTIPLYGNGGMMASANDGEERTIPFYGEAFEKAASHIPGKENTEQVSPCVAWLVCVDGMYVGYDFRLFVGRNTIGRSDTNSVALSGDTSVSKEPQAIVVYEPQGNRFFAVPGTARSLCYVNGQLLLSQTELRKNDIIELGKAKLMLIPCCDDKFNWNSIFAE